MKEQKIGKEEFFLLVGPAQFAVTSGAVEVIAARIGKGEKLNVPLGKRVPIRALEDTVLQVECEPDKLTKMEGSSIPAEWDALAKRVVGERRDGRLYSILVLGEVDTGKTFFSTYIANRLLHHLKRTAILDCDTGQSDIGPPGTFGMLVMKKPVVFLTEEPATYLYMLGAHSPGLHFLPALTGLAAMLEKARADADALIIDTTGWVQGDGGRAIKKSKLDIVNPDMVVLMQRGTELEHLVKHLPKERVVRLPVSKKASSTSQMERKSLRELVSVRYFKGAQKMEIPFSRVFTDRCYFLTGTPLTLDGALHAERLSAWEGSLAVTAKPLTPDVSKGWPKEIGRVTNFVAGDEKGLMVGLLDDKQNCLAIARLDEIDFAKKCFRLRTPFSGSPEQVRGIQFGSLKLAEDGREAGFIEPGSI
ncbi:MAG TPA: Clp1/GlmU family protein [Elusimicrobiota bacterium]|nr:Clp1/GlmU family protein [Elusimicrobiota bacterium]